MLGIITRSQAVARIADRTAKNCRGHVTRPRGHAHFQENLFVLLCSALPIQRRASNLKSLAQVVLFKDMFDRMPKIVGVT